MSHETQSGADRYQPVDKERYQRLLDDSQPELPASPTKQPGKFRRNITAFVAGASIAAGIGAGVKAGEHMADEVREGRQVAAAQEAFDDVINQGPESGIHAQVEAEVNKQKDIRTQVIEGIAKQHKNDPMPYHLGVEHPELEMQYHQMAIDNARETGLHLEDDRPYEQPLDDASNIQEALEVFNSYADHHDLKFSMKGEQPNLEDFKVGAKATMRALAYLPTEVSGQTGIHEVQIVDQVTGTNGAPVAGPKVTGNPEAGVVQITTQAFSEGERGYLLEQMGRAIDYKATGGHDQMDLDEANKASLYANMLIGLNPSLMHSQSDAARGQYAEVTKRATSLVPNYDKYLKGISSDELYLADAFDPHHEGLQAAYPAQIVSGSEGHPR